MSIVAPVPPVAPAITGDEQSAPRASSDAEPAPQYRLVIEEGPTSGSFIYKTLDRATGEVVRQFPREQVLRLAEARRYDAGSVIDTNA
ncbi:MAG TPA: flagellar protein FlaG [Brevundimonas sp.]